MRRYWKALHVTGISRPDNAEKHVVRSRSLGAPPWRLRAHTMSDVEALISAYACGALSRRAFVGRLLALGVSVDFAATLLGPSVRLALADSVRAKPTFRGPRLI